MTLPYTREVDSFVVPLETVAQSAYTSPGERKTIYYFFHTRKHFREKPNGSENIHKP